MWLKRLADPVSWIMLLLFDRVFLETRRHLPGWDRAFVATIVVYAVGELLNFFGQNQGTRDTLGWVWEAASYVIAFLGIAAGVLRYRQGFVPAKYFVAAQSVLSLGLLLIFQQDRAWYPLNYLPDGVFWRYVRDAPLWIAAAAEAILFSMGLSNRINLLRATVARHALEREQERKREAIEHTERLEVEVAERTQELRLEKENANHLLHNILPVDVANELIANGSTQPQRFAEATILFTDFRDFTKTVASLPANQVVEELNDIFRHFDDIIDACGIEKIKTIGDSYMIAGGLPKPLPDHAERCVDAALRMQAYLEKRNNTSTVKWNMRAGIHSGEVVAGVVGKKKFTYDVWGDTVNTASRMESAGEPGRVNISASTYGLVKSRYKGEYRGKLDAKGKGDIDMYFVMA
jgi:class 3 adenylate cyclase